MPGRDWSKQFFVNAGDTLTPFRDLRDFLYDRLGEEEAAAEAAQQIDPAPWRAEATDDGPGPEIRPVLGGGMVIAADEVPLWDSEGSFLLCMTAPTTRHVARWDPVHVLADIKAKRRILEACRAAFSVNEISTFVLAEETLKRLAEPYAEHPAYKPEWRPYDGSG